MPSSASMEKLINSLLASADSEAFREPVNWRALGLHDYPTIIKRPMDLGTVKLRLERGAYPTAEACAADVRLIWENCRTYNAGGVPRKLHKAADNLSKRFEARFAKMPAGERLKLASGGGGSNGHGKGRGCGGGRGGVKAGGEAGPPPPTSEDRHRLARQLGRARMEQLTAVVHEIDRRCPEALILRQARQGAGGAGAEAEEVEDDQDSDGGGGDGGGGRSGGSGVGDVAAMMSGTAAIEIEVDVDALDAWTFCAVERVVAPLAAQRRGATSTSTARKRPAKRKKPTAAAAAAAEAMPAVKVAAASNSTNTSGGGTCIGGGKKRCIEMAGRQETRHHPQEGPTATAAAAPATGEVGRNMGKGAEEDARGGAGASREGGEEPACKKARGLVETGGAFVATKRADDEGSETVPSQPEQTADRS